MKVLCFGSLNIDYTYRVDHFVGKGETLAAESLQVFSGGKGLNQAIALARAGVIGRVYFPGFVRDSETYYHAADLCVSASRIEGCLLYTSRCV